MKGLSAPTRVAVGDGRRVRRVAAGNGELAAVSAGSPRHETAGRRELTEMEAVD